MKLVSTIMFTLFCVLYMGAQKGEISGKILLNYSDKPGIGAVLTLKGTSHKAVSDSDGAYLINGIARGNYNLEVAYPGIREKKIINLNVDTNQKVVLNFEFCYNQHTVRNCPADDKSAGITRIVYGTPTTKELKKIAKGIVRKSEFSKSNCSPNYFCKKHQLEF